VRTQNEDPTTGAALIPKIEVAFGNCIKYLLNKHCLFPTSETMTTISGWGRHPVVETDIVAPRTLDAARVATARTEGGVARGNGRAYGDASIGAQQTLQMGGLDRIRAFDATTGLVTVEAGVLLADLIAAFLPRGFFPAVVPGTKFVTIGGTIAADVHGKNHHRDGGFGDHVESLVLATAGGDLIRASRHESPDLFAATIGGMGLTGTIVEATLRLRPVETGWIRQRTIVAPDLTEAIAALAEGDSATYSVAWIDCTAKGSRLGRSLVFLGEHAVPNELHSKASANLFPKASGARLAVPIDCPAIVLNHWSVGAFNSFYFRLGARRAGEPFLVPADSYFFPLDGIDAWNRIYGRRGFVQHQCVLPVTAAPGILAEMLGRIAARGDASFLTVLKKLGSSNGILSFPFPGYTLALDFPLAPGLFGFLDELDRLVVAAGGRLYLAKDARQSRTTFEAGYPGLQRFRDIRNSVDPTRRIRSRLSERLGI
jgi:FAD/FMN-containing dehydrogenase